MNLRHSTPLLGLTLAALTACQSDPAGTPEASADSNPTETLEVSSTDLAAPALVGDVTTAELGATAPDFVLADSNGTSHQLSDFRGRPVVLEWVNHGCPYVAKHYDKSDNMQSLQASYTEQDVVWLTICSSAEGKQGFMSNDDWNASIADRGANQTALLVDATGIVGKAFEARVTPHMYVIDADGMLVYSGAIDSDGSRSPESIETADNYVADTLDSLLAGDEVEPFSTQPYGCGIKYQ